jgi:hypothetical protein
MKTLLAACAISFLTAAPAFAVTAHDHTTTTPTTPAPTHAAAEPISLALGGAALLGAAILRRR